MQKFDKFVNELNTETYLSAADIADERGETSLADDLRDHAVDMEEKEIEDEEKEWVDKPALDDVPFDEEPLHDEMSFEMKSFDNFNESYDDVLDGGMEDSVESDVPVGPNIEEVPEESYSQDIIDDEIDCVEDEIVASIGEEEPFDDYTNEGLKSFDSFSINEDESFSDEGNGELELKCKDCGCDCEPEEDYCKDCEQNHIEDLGEPNDDLGDDTEIMDIHQFEGVKTFENFSK